MLVMGMTVTGITIEEMQMMSKMFLMAAGILTALAVILFVCFDIRNIWGLIVRHKSRVIKPIQMEENRETVPLDKTELEEKTVLLENPNGAMKILQDKTCIHTDIRIT